MMCKRTCFFYRVKFKGGPKESKFQEKENKHVLTLAIAECCWLLMWQSRRQDSCPAESSNIGMELSNLFILPGPVSVSLRCMFFCKVFMGKERLIMITFDHIWQKIQNQSIVHRTIVSCMSLEWDLVAGLGTHVFSPCFSSLCGFYPKILSLFRMAVVALVTVLFTIDSTGYLRQKK